MDDMTQQQKVIANYMAAVAQLLTGSAKRFQEFNDKVQLICGGGPVHALNLLKWGDHVRATGRPILYFHATAEAPTVPQIALVSCIDGHLRVIENCMLTLGKNDRRARLVPDGFNLGAYVLGNDLTLRFLKRAPAKDYESAGDDMVRAYQRLIDLEAEQWEKGVIHPLPERREMKKAA